MKLTISTGAILALQLTTTVVAKLHTHDKLAAIERRHHQHLHAARHAQPSPAEGIQLEERQGVTCPLPSGQGLYYVPGAQNGGWAMSPNQICSAGTWCPYACPAGELMTSWNPAIPNYPSIDGGLLCGSDGNAILPDGPLCKAGATNIQAVDATGKGVSFCQTVTPGNEAQLIPTWVGPNSQQTLAIPQPDYFGKIAAHYYINEPGAGITESCVWGDSSTPLGNWAPFVGGGHQDADGTTWIDLGANPMYTSQFAGTPVNFKIEIICDGECNNPCAYDPSQHGMMEMVGTEGVNWFIGDGGAPFCTTCVTSGSAYYKISMVDGSDASSAQNSPASGNSAAAAAPSPSAQTSPTTAAAVSSSPSPSSTVTSAPSGAATSQTSSATTYSPHILLQEGSSTSAAANSTSTSTAMSSSMTIVSTSSATGNSTSNNATSTLPATMAPTGAASHFAAPITGAALTGLLAMLFL